MYYVHNPNNRFVLNLANMYITSHNPAYRSKQSYENEMKFGSRHRFHVNCHINGEYFREVSNNQYFAIVNKSTDPKNVRYFVPSTNIMNHVIDPKKEKLLRLEIVKNKKYWIESSQAIDVYDENPDVVVLNTPIEDLIIPEFVPVPEH
jgi:hypothetical protein